MSNKKIAIILIIFLVIFMTITLLIGISSKLPLINRAVSLVFAVILLLFTVGVFVFFGRKRK